MPFIICEQETSIRTFVSLLMLADPGMGGGGAGGGAGGGGVVILYAAPF